MALDPATAAAELLRRRRARASLEDYAQAIDVPGRPVSNAEDEWLFDPVESPLALHHRVILRHLQQCMTTPYGRLMIFAPPGSAKSSYASVVAPTWYMGYRPGARIILTSYATQIALKQARRARQIARSPAYSAIWNALLPKDQQAVDAWALSNKSEFMAAGIQAGITGNRAEGAIIDDPVAGREEADSETIQRKTLDAYQDDLLTRLVPGAWLVLMMTRWHMNDLAGALLPEDYAGESGPIRCRDGMVWTVLNIPAMAVHADDPLGRQPGEFLWPEWFDEQHWRMVKDNPSPQAQRTWAALYQQHPVPDSGGQFQREWFQWYEPGERPEHLNRYAATDYAVTSKAGDWTEHGVFGVCEQGDLWGVDWWSGQEPPNVTIGAMLDLQAQHRTLAWVGERGVIENAISPARDRAMRDRGVWVHVELLPSVGDKIAKVQSFRAYAQAGRVHLPRGAEWAERLVEQLCAFPMGRYDDKVDVCGLIGRYVDQIADARVPKPRVNRGPTPFTEDWFAARDREDAQAAANRARYYR